MRYKFNTKWNKKVLECACLFGNPGCSKFRECEVLEMTFKPFEDIGECMNHDSYERRHGVIVDKRGNGK